MWSEGEENHYFLLFLPRGQEGARHAAARLVGVAFLLSCFAEDIFEEVASLKLSLLDL